MFRIEAGLNPQNDTTVLAATLGSKVIGYGPLTAKSCGRKLIST
jgi:hypothetical protein